jgi:hypothetical protein
VFPQVVPGLNQSTIPGDFVFVGFMELIVVLWFCCFPRVRLRFQLSSGGFLQCCSV